MTRQRYTCWTRVEFSTGSETFCCEALHRSREAAERCEIARRQYGSRNVPHYIGEVGPGGRVYAEGVVVLTLPPRLLPKWLREAA